MNFGTLDDVNVRGLRVLVRSDLNVTTRDGVITNPERIESALTTIRELSDKGAKVILLSHLGDPKDRSPEFSLVPIADVLSGMLERPVYFAEDCIGEPAETAVRELTSGDIVLLENTRFHPGEKKNDPNFAKALAAFADIYVNDAFSAAHRAHASTEGLAHQLPTYAGRLMQAELTALNRVLERPQHPVMAIVGGSKVSTKLGVLRHLVEKTDKLVLGGGMANTFLHATGVPIGVSMHEADMANEARAIMELARTHHCEIVLPVDAQLADAVQNPTCVRMASIGDIKSHEMILDVGADSVNRIISHMNECKTLLWNGPLGVFEVPPFDEGTVAIAHHAGARVQSRHLCAVAGGGDTAAAMRHAGVAGNLTYLSLAGGAFLEWLEGKSLPGVQALAARSSPKRQANPHPAPLSHEAA